MGAGDGLLLAAYYGYHDAALELLQARAPVDHRDADGLTPLRIAIENSHDEMAKLLCGHRADLSIVDEHGHQPLHAAISLKKFGVASLLVAQGANVEAASPSGTPLEMLAQDTPSDMSSNIGDRAKLAKQLRKFVKLGQQRSFQDTEVAKDDL